MADLKISQLTDGGASQAADEYVIARSGSNYRIDGASVAAAATSVGTLTSLTVSGNTSLASSSGGVGIGVAAGSSKLNVAGTFTKNTGDENTWGIRVTDDTAMTTGVGGGLVFVGNYTSGGGKASFASIAGAKANSTTANGLGELRFYTTDVSSVLQQRAVIDGAGNLAVDTNTLYVDAANNRVGVGTASPGTTLHATATGGTFSSPLNNVIARFNATTNTAGQGAGIALTALATKETAWVIAAEHTSGNNGDLTFYGYQGGATYAELMRMSNAGNLGLGVTPSAWGTTNSIRALQLNSGALWNFSTGGLNLIQNGYYDGSNYKYVATAAASQYSQSSGAHSWSIAASGTAGNTISFTQAMTLGADTYLTLNGAATDGRIQLTNTARSTSDGFWVGIDGTQSYLLSRGSYPLIFYTNAAERARITSGGSFLMAANSVIGLNTSDGSDNGYLVLVGAGADGENRGGGIYLHGNERSSEAGSVVLQAGNVATTGIVSFRTGAGTERARITSGGYFKASPNGTYNNATGTYHEFVSTSDNTGTVVVKHTGTSGAQYGITITTVNDQNDATRYFWSGEGAGVERGTLRSNGGLANYSANNVNLASDERLKKDIAPLTSTWDKLKAIEVVNFRYKDCNDGDPALYGVIAQQVQPIVPELVVVTREAVEAKDAVLDEDGNEVKPAVEAKPEYYGIREQPMYWLAIKALQEAQARIEALEARLEALEA